MNLQLSLKRKWFEITKAGIKTEDYREINNFWFKRLFGLYIKDADTGKKSDDSIVYSVISLNKDIILKTNKPKTFTQNIMTLGYPKKGDPERTLTLEHKGIEIRTGNPEWGAEEGKLYFVIKHGEIIK